MQFVADTNILITFFWKSSVLREILKKDIGLVSPEYSLQEIDKYKDDIMKRAKLTQTEFNKIKEELKGSVDFIPLNDYVALIKKTKSLLLKFFTEHEIIEFLDDLDFFALAVKFEKPIWSNDKLFKKQQVIPIFNTQEVIELVT